MASHPFNYPSLPLTFYSLANAENIPKQIFELPGAAQQILNFQSSESTSELWEIAHGYKKTASDHRLGLPRVQNQSLKKAAAAGVAKNVPGIAKGVRLLQEMHEKRDQGKKIKFTIALYKVNLKGKPECVRQFTLIYENLLSHEDNGTDSQSQAGRKH